ncbi:hypothetical protein G6O69_03405 [Pseudenhygromyxa sp. WMMC2535]|uniref:hypothetical protein n=1 Tax=Pseudenhygromyxa sp. WMMC2535 TaxID=2712867 RepID=UPI0015525C20|nr:hypothetical protein [Pseudenhygromyxa sp. WMMC2535]NVB36861.1 hypothetical protein [Pseudenhygromyxa sp. WMMC2535]
MSEESGRREDKARRRGRERMTCGDCGWVGITAHGYLRWAVFGLAVFSVLAAFVLERAGVLGLGDQLWPLGITIMLVSLGLRLLIRGDRCPECGAQVDYRKR